MRNSSTSSRNAFSLLILSGAFFGWFIRNLNMLFFDATSDQLYCGVRGLDADKQKTVFVLWVNHAHFEPICRENPGGREPTFCYSTDDPDVKRMMKLYRQELCTGDQDDVNMLLG